MSKQYVYNVVLTLRFVTQHLAWRHSKQLTISAPVVDFTKSGKSKINRKCYRKCDFQAFDWLKFTLTTDLRLTTFCEIDHRTVDCNIMLFLTGVSIYYVMYCI
jgi:hypothetical protein